VLQLQQNLGPGIPYFESRRGSHIGLWFIGAGDARLDNFGGGDVSGGESLVIEGPSNPISTPAVDSFNMTSPDASPFWQGLTLGASQPSLITFSNVNGTIGKPRSNGVWGDNTVQALYDIPNNRIQLWRYDAQAGWIQSGADIPVTFASGDVFSARALSNGTVEIQRNGVLLATRVVTVASAPQQKYSLQPVAFHLPAMNFAPLLQSSPVTITYVYDPLNRLKEANYSNGDYYHYTYDAVGNRLSQTTSISGQVSTINYVYDDANRLTSVDGVTYVYDNNGNLLNDGVTDYTYDSANRLTSFTNATTTVTYRYNGLNDRLQETVNGIITTFTMDLNTGLTQALSDGTNHYIYGFGRIAQVNTTTEYFLGDALGSVRQLVDSGGTVTLAKSYAPYGETRSSAGSGTSPFAFTGEQVDASGLTYLRSRYYSGGTGRFISRDTWNGNANSPMSYNRWAYVNGNPINLTDPTGNHPGNHSIYCNPLTGVDRLYCERIVRGISPTANVSMVEMSVLDACSFAYNTEECFCLENISPGRMSELENLSSIPLHASLPHSVYSGTWKQYGWWWHYLLDRTPGWWNNYGEDHIMFSDVIAFALGVELSTMAKSDENADIWRYAAAAFATKGSSDGFYKMIGSRQSVFMRVNTALYGNPGGGSYNFNKYGSKFNEIFKADSDYHIKANMRSLGKQILQNTGFTAEERLAYEWGNPTNRTPESFLSALRSGNMGSLPTQVLYFSTTWKGKENTPWYEDETSGLRIYEIAFVVTQQQLNTLCNYHSCVNP
jgi:RHS repeat-associated protein